MARVLVTGMSGAGKSTLLASVAARGYPTVDTDDDGWHLPDGRWVESRMDDLLAQHSTVAVSGTADNQGRFYDRFEHVVYLYAPVDVLLARVATRTTNPYGTSPEDQAEIVRYVAEVEPRLRRGATVELDASRPLSELADELQRLLGFVA
jgi:shikimate kinase